MMLADFPISDWQFWVASLVALFAFVFVVRPFLPTRRPTRTCPKCSDHPAPTGPKKAKLTIEGARPARRDKTRVQP
ncbi:MAG: hypothetical protein EXS03_04640 [Phycisphaerales bacterium]|nr:hypothetical protein [Phycisphaerales bacterium]